tara:strand:+ start:1842 stop:1970 length:129 start_codon:yes stop_codon:yes gene_type:complete
MSKEKEKNAGWFLYTLIGFSLLLVSLVPLIVIGCLVILMFFQ